MGKKQYVNARMKDAENWKSDHSTTTRKVTFDKARMQKISRASAEVEKWQRQVDDLKARQKRASDATKNPSYSILLWACSFVMVVGLALTVFGSISGRYGPGFDIGVVMALVGMIGMAHFALSRVDNEQKVQSYMDELKMAQYKLKSAKTRLDNLTRGE